MSRLPKIKRNFEFIFDGILKIWLVLQKNICFLLLPICLSSFGNHFFCFKNSAHGQKIVVKLATRKVHSITVVVEMVVKVIKHPQSRKPSLQCCL